MLPFTPITTTKNVAATTSSDRVAMGSTGNSVGHTARVYNSGTVTAFVEFGTSTVTAAAATSIAMAPGSVEVFGIGAETHMAAITGAGTATVYVTLGDGY